ncbi:putative bifunctional diguanylate cyclase/phosphodiesterase [Oceanobacillus halophilus]|uniref:EAL domain-containing protein n=1 Tax=Oceanobacillus halophilus TaxID=930130 RepID=A0A495A2Y6_9BACI|nr:EAL domain-containing protein [Oceanobacillus halophilus]RKQ32467.1 EAL domain-containing protein [Oceanobacillus halophilus]
MSYKGRIIGFILILINGIIVSTYSYTSTGSMELNNVVASLIQLPLGWFIGKQFDKVHYLNNKLQNMAYHDYLTNLPNRLYLANVFKETMENAENEKKELAILYMDLDRFKSINDTMGHDVGDQLLVQVSNRLVANVRKQDVVARQGGDEFIILLNDVDKTQVKEVADQILHSFAAPFTLNKEDFYTSPSIGISLFPEDGQDINLLSKNADAAMYLSKKRGRNNYQFYNNEEKDILDRKFILEQGLTRALLNNEFLLYYQPKVDLETNTIYGAEALIRWDHPEYGLISPFEFIPIAEEAGYIIPIGKWVIESACKQAALWQKQGISLNIAVNVSAKQFQDKRFVKIVEDTLNNYQLAPGLLELEITESVMQDVEESYSMLQQLKSIGVKTSIDDFGTGYSSLNILNSVSIDYVKIDKSFIDDMLTNSSTASLVKTIIQIGSNLNFELIAEGIEQESQTNFLIQHGCHLGQGYLYSPPLPLEEMDKVIQKQQERLLSSAF